MSESNTPRQLGNYDLLEPVGAGSVGTVYKATDRRTNAIVALKLISRTLDDASADGLRAETEKASNLESPYIARVIELGEDGTRRFIAGEYVDGLSLETLIKRGPIAAPVALQIALQVAMALQAASVDGILHRDIKPQNILLAEDGTAKLADFGEASLVFVEGKLQSVDTAAYAAPEQLGGVPSVRSDIYSLGAVMFEMLSGHRPFDGDSVETLIPMHLGRQPALDQLPPAFRSVVGRCLEKAEARRYQSPSELIAALQEVRQQLAAAPATGTLATVASTPEMKPAAAAVTAAGSKAKTAEENVRFAPQPRGGDRLPKSRIIAGVLGVGVIAAVVVGAILAFSGGSKAEKAQFPTDPKTADRLAHNALIPVAALPGPDWKISNLDSAEPDKHAVETDNCKAVNANQDQTKAFDSKSRIARAKEDISRPVARVPLPTTVSVEIDLYKTTSGLDGRLTSVRKLTDSGTYIKCFSDLIDNAFKSTSFKATTTTVTPTMPPPDNGFAFAAESKVDGLDTPLRFENYGWLTSNAKVTVSFSGSKDQVTMDLVKAAIEKTQSSLANATAYP